MSDGDHPYGNQDLFYRDFYSRTVGTAASGLRGILWKYPHRLVERSFQSNLGCSILEIGSGNGEHFQFVRKDFKKYVAVDIRISDHLLSQNHSSFEYIEANAEDLGVLEDSTFDRIVAMCLLAHLLDPESALLEIRRVAKSGSTIQIYVPCEPGLALRTFRNLITAPAVKKMGFQGFDLFMAREHRNALNPLLVMMKNIYREDQIRIRRRPFPFLGWYLNLFYLVEIRVTK